MISRTFQTYPPMRRQLPRIAVAVALFFGSCDADLADLGKKDGSASTGTPDSTEKPNNTGVREPVGGFAAGVGGSPGGPKGSGGAGVSPGSSGGSGGTKGSIATGSGGGSAMTPSGFGGMSSVGFPPGSGGMSGGGFGMGGPLGTGGTVANMAAPCTDTARSQDCPPNLKCTVDCSSRRPTCQPAGTVAVGQPCDRDAQCSRGSGCMKNTCVRFCKSQEDCSIPLICLEGPFCEGQASALYCR